MISSSQPNPTFLADLVTSREEEPKGLRRIEMRFRHVAKSPHRRYSV